MYDFAKTIQAFFEAIKGLSSYAETAKKRQCETDVLKNKVIYLKKSEKQEDLLLEMALLLRKYMSTFTRIDKVKTKVLLSKIKKVN